MAASRAVWSGFIRFNLVSVPVKAYTAAQSGGGGIALNQLHKDCNSRIKYTKSCPEHGEIRSDEIVSGYQFAKEQYVVIDPSDIEKLKTKGDKAISIEAFISQDTIDARYYSGKNYFLSPDGAVGQKPYLLLHKAMRESKRFGFARVFFSGSDQIVLVRPMGKMLVMTMLNYAQDMKDATEFEKDVTDTDLPANELKLAKTLIDAMSVSDKEFDFAAYRDTYTDNLKTLIDAKIAGQEVVAAKEVEQAPQFGNLMEALERSLAETKNKKPPKLVAPSPAAAAKSARQRKSS